MQHLFGLRPGNSWIAVENVRFLNLKQIKVISSLKMLHWGSFSTETWMQEHAMRIRVKITVQNEACPVSNISNLVRIPWTLSTGCGTLIHIQKFALTQIVDTGRSVLRLAADHGRRIPNRQSAMRGLSEVKFSVLP